MIRGDSQYRYGHAYIHAAHCKKVDDGCIRHLDVQAASALMWVAWHEKMFCQSHHSYNRCICRQVPLSGIEQQLCRNSYP
jgi:hypothetical protein